MSKSQVLLQLWELVKYNRKYWLLPIIIVLVLTGLALVFAQGSALAPFLYPLF
jgi:hypothetical protein